MEALLNEIYKIQTFQNKPLKLILLPDRQTGTNQLYSFLNIVKPNDIYTIKVEHFVNNRLSKKGLAIFDDYFSFKATTYDFMVKHMYTLEVKTQMTPVGFVLELRYKEYIVEQ